MGEKNTATLIEAEIPNHEDGWIGVETKINIDENGVGCLSLGFYTSHPIKADTIIVKTDMHRYTLDVSERRESDDGEEWYLILIYNNELLQLMQEIGDDNKPEKIRFSGEFTIDGKLKFRNDQTDVSVRKGFKSFARDYELAKGLKQDFSSYVHTPCEVVSVEPWEWEEDTVQETGEAETTESIEESTKRSEEKTKRSKVYTDEETIKMVQEQLNNLGYDCGEADGVKGEKTKNAIIKYQKDNGLTVSGKIDASLLKALSIIIANNDYLEVSEENGRTQNIITDETEWENWKSTGRCMLFPFMKASDLLDFSWGNPQRDGDHVWVECFEENGDFGMYYCVDNQRITYAGLYTDNINVFSSEAFRNTCVKLIR